MVSAFLRTNSLSRLALVAVQEIFGLGSEDQSAEAGGPRGSSAALQVLADRVTKTHRSPSSLEQEAPLLVEPLTALAFSVR